MPVFKIKLNAISSIFLREIATIILVVCIYEIQHSFGMDSITAKTTIKDFAENHPEMLDNPEMYYKEISEYFIKYDYNKINFIDGYTKLFMKSDTSRKKAISKYLLGEAIYYNAIRSIKHGLSGAALREKFKQAALEFLDSYKFALELHDENLLIDISAKLVQRLSATCKGFDDKTKKRIVAQFINPEEENPQSYLNKIIIKENKAVVYSNLGIAYRLKNIFPAGTPDSYDELAKYFILAYRLGDSRREDKYGSEIWDKHKEKLKDDLSLFVKLGFFFAEYPKEFSPDILRGLSVNYPAAYLLMFSYTEKSGKDIPNDEKDKLINNFVSKSLSESIYKTELQAFIAVGDYFLKQKKYDVAFQYYSKAINDGDVLLSRDYPLYLLKTARCCEKNNDNKTAIALYDKCVELANIARDPEYIIDQANTRKKQILNNTTGE